MKKIMQTINCRYAVGRSGFTLTELIVAIGLLVGIMLAANKVFELSARTVALAEGNAEIMRNIAGIAQQFKRDIEHIRYDGHLVLVNKRIWIDGDNDGQYDGPADIKTRADFIAFCTTGDFRSMDTDYGQTLRSNTALVWYGLGINVVDAQVDPPLDPYGDPNDWGGLTYNSRPDLRDVPDPSRWILCRRALLFSVRNVTHRAADELYGIYGKINTSTAGANWDSNEHRIYSNFGTQYFYATTPRLGFDPMHPSKWYPLLAQGAVRVVIQWTDGTLGDVIDPITGQTVRGLLWYDMDNPKGGGNLIEQVTAGGALYPEEAYRAVWVPSLMRTSAPKALRMIITLRDPHSRLPSGRKFVLVAALP